MDSIGIPTFIGSSNRVYPESGIKPIAVLNAILDVLNKQELPFYTNRLGRAGRVTMILFSIQKQ
jgi:hypothetical protein